jgi:hypothetical protein
MRRGLYYTLKHLYDTARKCDYSQNIALLNLKITDYIIDKGMYANNDYICYRINGQPVLRIEGETWGYSVKRSYKYYKPNIMIEYKSVMSDDNVIRNSVSSRNIFTLDNINYHQQLTISYIKN